MLIDFKDLSSEALIGIAKEYVISQLSDVELDTEIDAWTQQIIFRVKKGELVVEFSEVDESVALKKIQDVIFQE